MSLRALFVGLGGVGQRHLRNLRQLYGSDLIALAYRVRRERAIVTDQLTIKEGGDVEDEFNLQVFDDLDAALTQVPDICVVANPTALHVPVARAALKAGADLFVEKPLAADRKGVDELLRLCKAQSKITFVAFQLRFHPAVQELQRQLKLGRCGTVYGATAEVAEYLPLFHPYEDYRRMYASRKELGGGVVLTQIHEIDLIYSLFGIPEQVFAVGGHISDLDLDVEDSSTALLKYRRDDGTPWAVQLHQDYLGRPPRRKLHVWGSEGGLALNLRKGTLLWTDTEGRSELLVNAEEYPRNQLFLDEMSHFLGCIERRSQPLVNLADGAASLEIALAIKESLSTGAPIALKRDA